MRILLLILSFHSIFLHSFYYAPEYPEARQEQEDLEALIESDLDIVLNAIENLPLNTKLEWRDKLLVKFKQDILKIIPSLEPLTQLIHIQKDTERIKSIAISDDSQYVIWGCGNTAYLYDIQESIITTLGQHDSSIEAVAINKNSSLAATGDHRGKIKLWNLNTCLPTEIPAHKYWITAVAFTPDNKYLLSTSGDKEIMRWELNTLEYDVLRGHTEVITCLEVSADSKYAISGSYDNTAKIWDLKALRTVATITHEDIVFTVSFGPDSQSVLTGSKDKKLICYNFKNGNVNTFSKHRHTVVASAISADGKYAVSGSLDKNALIWDLKTGKLLFILPDQKSGVSAVAICPTNNNIILVGTGDGELLLYSLSALKTIKIKHDSMVYISQVKFSKDGKYVVTSDYHGNLIIWEYSDPKEFSLEQLILLIRLVKAEKVCREDPHGCKVFQTFDQETKDLIVNYLKATNKI